MTQVRILHVVTSMDAGGIETFLMNTYRHLDRSRVQFDFLTHRPQPGLFEPEILDLGGRIFRMDALRLSRLPAYMITSLRFFRQHSEYSIVHSHINQKSFLPLLAARLTGAPTRVAHSHASVGAGTERSLRLRVATWLGQRGIGHVATDLFACSREAGEWLFGTNSNFVTVANAIDAGRFAYSVERRARARTLLKVTDELVIGHTGNFTEAKNYPFLLDVFFELLKMRPNSRLVLIGNDKNDPEVARAVKRRGLSDHVILTGIRSDVDDLLQGVDVFLFPSIAEGLPVALIEAQAAGLKCVVSDSVSNEVDVTGQVQFVSLADSPGVWAQHVLEASQGGDRTLALSSIVSAGYDISDVASSLQSFYLSRGGV